MLRTSWSFSGLIGAIVGFTLALTPSLLPRPGAFLGVVAGVGAVVGYGLGVLVAKALRGLGVPRAKGRAMRRAWLALEVLGPIAVLVALVLGGIWQLEVLALSEQDASTLGLMLALAVGVLLAVALLVVARALRAATRGIARRLRRWIPPRAAMAAGVVAVALTVWWVLADLLVPSLIAVADAWYAQSNAQTPAGVTQPPEPQRSGSPASLVAWDSLGAEGRAFTASGPRPKAMQELSGEAALEPIRVYAGVDSADTAQARADLAVRELERTGAFDRAVLVVAGATGTGWLEPETTAALEYMWNGDTAIVAIQYSFLPSWISFLTDQERAGDAGRALFDAVHEAWERRTPSERPLLISYGLSLGSFTAQSAFPTIDDVLAGTQRAFYVGTPGFSQPWGDVTAAREPGSPQWQPVYGDGVRVRFVGGRAELESESDVAGERTPDVLYLQHGNDPVVWWNWNLIWRRPDWLSGERAPDVPPSMTWLPGVTFLQVSIDQFFGTSVPIGQGHNYADASVAAWSLLVPPPGWTAQDAARLQDVVLPPP